MATPKLKTLLLCDSKCTCNIYPKPCSKRNKSRCIFHGILTSCRTIVGCKSTRSSHGRERSPIISSVCFMVCMISGTSRQLTHNTTKNNNNNPKNSFVDRKLSIFVVSAYNFPRNLHTLSHLMRYSSSK